MEDLDKLSKSYHYIWHVFPPETSGLSDTTHKIYFTEEDIELFLTMDRCMYTDEEYLILIKWLNIHKKIYKKFKPFSSFINTSKKQQGTQILQYFGNDADKVMTFYMFWYNIISKIEINKISNIFNNFMFDDKKNFFDYIDNMHERMILNKDYTPSSCYPYTIEGKIDQFRRENNLTLINWEREPVKITTFWN